MINIFTEKNLLLLEYYPENGTQWIYNLFKAKKPITIRKTFTFKENDIYEGKEIHQLEGFYEDSIIFRLGVLEGNYYKINSDVLGIDVNLFIHSSIRISDKMFTAHRNISVFGKVNNVVKEDIYIGIDSDKLPYNVFQTLIKSFPNSTELDKYAHARISSIVRDYFDNSIDAEFEYERYLARKHKNQTLNNLVDFFSDHEYEKYCIILNKLRDMLKNEIIYNEKTWQKAILEIIQLVYPKYIRVFEEVTIRDVYNQKNKRLDYMLVDSNGNIDIVEIKKPFNQSIVSQNKYRDNHIPLKELSGSVMQIEKYIYFLNKWGKQGEEVLTERYKDELPGNFKIKVINPSGLIIMGRENMLTGIQLEDFEVIKRKYKNVIDIITYDELIARLEHIIFKFKKKE